jgi:hypothetical protein
MKTDVSSSGTGVSQLQRRLTTSCSLSPVFTLKVAIGEVTFEFGKQQSLFFD